MKDNKMDIFHTFTDTELRGRGLAEKLTLAAFEYAEKHNLKIIPTCPYVKDKFLADHEEFEKIVEHW